MDLHPIVTQLTPSLEQLPAVQAVNRDIVVTAGAGTGKTRTLVARYLSLLAQGHSQRSVVAITFTRKAAREMRNRIREEMCLYLDCPDLDPAERELWRGRYRDLDSARIGTIHSLCTEILRSHPAEASIDPRFEVLDDGQASLLLGRAVEQSLAWAADDEQAVVLFSLLGERPLRSAMEELVGLHVAAQAALDNMPSDLLGRWRQALVTQQERTIIRLFDLPEWQQAHAYLLDNASTSPTDLREIQRRLALAALEQPALSLDERLASLSGLGAIKLTGGRQANWPGGKAQIDEVKEALRTLRGLWQDQSSVLELTITDHDRAVASAMPALQSLFEYAARIYTSLKADRHALDFDDLEHKALTLLKQSPAACARWQSEVSAILVDEFQDTNKRQRDLVALLNDNRGQLLIVGDAKQSIYRFRGADVEVFRQERDRIEKGGGLHVPLATSYRSHAQLLQALNEMLEPVLGARQDPDQPWAEPFAPLAPSRQQAEGGFAPPHIELHLTVGSKGSGALHRAARALTGRVLELTSGGYTIQEDSGPRPLGFGDVAILCRASTSFYAYEDALEQARIPFVTVAGRGFYSRPEIRDLLNALQSLAEPADDLAMVGLLRSPACGLSDEGLFHLCAVRSGGSSQRSLWDVLRSGDRDLSHPDADRASRAVGLISALHAQVGRVSVADLLKAFLDRTGYRAALIQAGQTRAARNVSKLLSDAHRSGIVGIGEFLEYVGSLRDSGVREGEARATAEGALQLMTVHAAKGLEFPVVIIGDLSRVERASHSLLLTPDMGPLLPVKDAEGQPTAAYCLALRSASDQDQAESDRLLYVAATRAREKLIISGCLGLKKDGSVSNPRGWMGKLAGPECLALTGRTIEHDEDGSRCLSIPMTAGDQPVSCAIYEPGFRPPSLVPPILAAPIRAAQVDGKTERAFLGAPPLLETVQPSSEQADAKIKARERTPPQRVWRVVPEQEQHRAPAWVIGSVVHEALAAWRFPDDAAPATEVDTSTALPARHTSDFGQWVQARTRGYGLTDARQLSDAASRIRTLLHRFQAHNLFADMDGADRRLHEVPYSRLVDGQVENGIIDALFLHNGDWTIVEFKTDRVRDDADFEALLRKGDYRAQAHRYLDAMGDLLGQRPRLILCMLNHTNAIHLELVT